ncbi:MAG: A24 family peptidase, partial [Acinetobacter sp.]|nr:A24 family peptidase [Acinetobacter sp.]
VIDWQHQLLPDRLVLPLLMVGLAVNSIQLVVSLEQAVWGAIIGFLSLWGIAKGFQLYTGKQGMGDGDFKLLAALGAWTGVQSLLFIIMLAAVLGIIVGIVQYRRLQQHQAFAFGPYLAIAAWLYMLYAPYFPLYLFGM